MAKLTISIDEDLVDRIRKHCNLNEMKLSGFFRKIAKKELSKDSHEIPDDIIDFLDIYQNQPQWKRQAVLELAKKKFGPKLYDYLR